MTEKEDTAILDSAANKLAEHWDCVQILVSRLRPDGGTASRRWGSGNFYARKAMCQEFMEMDQESNLAKAIAKEIKPDEPYNP